MKMNSCAKIERPVVKNGQIILRSSWRGLTKTRDMTTKVLMFKNDIGSVCKTPMTLSLHVCRIDNPYVQMCI